MNTYHKIKKYLFILCLFFTLGIFAHLGYIYLYEGSNKFPVVGGAVSVGFIGDMPSVNPLEFGLDPSNDYILKFLYRGLLKYDLKSKRMEGDIANCDLGKDFSRIKCYIKSDNFWNDGTPITKNDVLATYKALKETDINKPVKKVLENINIIDKGDYIEFASNNADVLLLDSFDLPILNEKQVSDIVDKKPTDSNLLTSGPYIFDKKEFDEKYGIKKVTILKKENYQEKDIYISKYIFKFFTDENSLLKNEDSLNIIFEDSNSKKLLVSPRFDAYKYILHQYIGLFLNEEKITNIDLRKFLLYSLDNINFSMQLPASDGKIINNPFFTNNKITPDLTNKNLSSIFSSMGFFKKEELIAEVSKKYENMLKPQTIQATIPNSLYFITPSKSKISFISNTQELLISGNVPAGTEVVYINDFKLNSFITGNTKFYFRAKKEYNTLKAGVNYYTLYTEIKGKKIKRETITVYAYDKQEDIDNKKKEIIENLSKTKELTQKEIDEIKTKKETELAKIEALDSIYFYDKNLIKFKLTLDYSNNGIYFINLANKLKGEFKILGIDLELKEIDSVATADIVKKGQKDYDMILSGINHGLYYYNISPFFYSGQAKEGFNFSKIKSIPLDLLTEKLKSSTLSEEKLSAIISESLDVLKKEAVAKTFYSPYNVFFIDKNIKNVDKIEMFPYSYYTYDAVKNSYIKEDWLIDYSKKSLSNFLSWTKNHFLK